MKHKNLKWILIFLILCILCAVFYLVKPREKSLTAQISSNGKLIKTVNLDENAEFTVENNGYNTIKVENGKIAVIDADCPDKVCVNRGFTDSGTLPIVCLPHKLVITVKGSDGNIDAVAGGK